MTTTQELPAQERERFEAYITRRYGPRRCDRNMPDKSYNDPLTYQEWEGWQARARLAAQVEPQTLSEGQIEAMAREDAGGSEIDWTNEANLFTTAPQRAAFRRGVKAALALGVQPSDGGQKE